MSRKVIVEDWGLIPYKMAWDKQEDIFQALIADKLAARAGTPGQESQQVLAFCEHPHVFTLGRSGKMDHLLVEPEALPGSYGAEFFRNNRGGDITYHGPGQVVGYPILDLDNFTTDMHLYMRRLEEVIILTLADYGLQGAG